MDVKAFLENVRLSCTPWALFPETPSELPVRTQIDLKDQNVGFAQLLGL
jgi:hypothetical protein